MYKNEIASIEKDIEKEQERQYELCSEKAESTSKKEHICHVVPPIIDKIKKVSEQLKVSRGERERILEEINVKEKQLELI